jgi:ABC-type multidrug transport system ATPase subunit
LQRLEVRYLLIELAGRRAFLLCTHDLSEARAVADRVAVLSRGRVVALGPADQVLGADDPLELFRSLSGDSP